MPESEKDVLTEFKVHFRGIAMYVANSKPNFITEVVFPRADKAPPDGEDDGIAELPPNKYHPKPYMGRKMKHADGSDAMAHFAGALIVTPGQEDDRRVLTGCAVERANSSGKGARMDTKFLQNVPSLDHIILDQKKKLKLLHDTKEPSRVATRFLIDGGKEDAMTAVSPAGGGWQFTQPNGHTSKPVDYCLEVLWTIKAPAPLTFNVTNLKGQTGGTLTPITLQDENTEVYFYNFDYEEPTVDDLLRVDDAELGDVDHDFKWLYKVMDKENVTWPAWLERTAFPAPELVTPPMVSVSTCFDAVWTGPSSGS